MGKACVYSIVVVLLIAVHSSMAFPSNIHDKMTSAEKRALFGSEDTVPEYEVFPLSLPGARNRRRADKNIQFKFEIDNKTITLDLKPTMRYLVTENTPIFSANSDVHAYNKIRYDPLETAMRDLGKYEMYHDMKNEAAVTIFDDPIEGSIMEGIVTAYYVIKSLPKRLMTVLLKEGRHLLKTPGWGKRSIISDSEEDKGYGVVFKTPNALKYVKSRRVYAKNLRIEKHSKNIAGKLKVPKAVYPEILIVVDYRATRGHNLTEVLRYTLTFWNGVDLIYRTLRKPKVYLNIAGIIISRDALTTPYIAKDELTTYSGSAENVLPEMGKYYYTESVRFPMNRYDIIIAMSGIPLSRGSFRGIPYGLAYKYEAPNAHACSSTREASKNKSITNVEIVDYTWTYCNIRTTAHITAHLFGAKNDLVYDRMLPPYCVSEEGYIMSEWVVISNQKMQWSNCSQRDMSRFFSSEESECLRNKPLWRKQVGEVLPGRWLTLDGQCQNEDYAKACKLKKSSICAVKGCQKKGSSRCVRSKRTSLPGSTCGKEMHCSAKKKCVHD